MEQRINNGFWTYTYYFLTKGDNIFCILQLAYMWFNLLLTNFMLQKGTNTINFTFAMTTCKVIPSHVYPFWPLLTNSQSWKPHNKIPCLSKLKLNSAPIIPNHMMFQPTSFSLQVAPMQGQSMLHKKAIMNVVITNVVMNFLYNSKFLRNGWVELGVNSTSEMRQNLNMELYQCMSWTLF